MQECIQKFEEFLDFECSKSRGTAVIDMQGVLSNLTFVQQKVVTQFAAKADEFRT